jgi:protein involved in polysaccharide export with SLBB domain
MAWFGKVAWFRRSGGLLAAVILATGLVAACSGSSSRAIPEATTGSGGPLVTPPQGAAAESVAGYRLGPGEKVRLTVFRHEDLSGEFDLDGEGFLAMPLVGEIPGAGLTARQLENEIEIRLKAGGYLVNPQVSVEVLNYRPFYIIGEVNNPGSYQYVNGMTVINAVALAGGFTYRADQDDIIITRGGSEGRKIDDVRADTPVLPGDIVEVTERFF